MITDNKCFKEVKKEQRLNSDLLVVTLLEKLLREGIINVATYEKAQREVRA